VIRLRFSVEDLSQVRFATSPLWEAVTSLRTLGTGSPTGLHAPWLAQVRRSLGDLDDLDLLTTVVRPAGYLPDFLHPIPPRRSPSFDTSLTMLAATDPGLVASELAHLARHPIAMRGPGRVHRRAVLDGLVADPRAGLARIVAALDGYWRVSIAPFWPRMRALLHADLAHRLQEVADGGVRQLFRTLHPAVSFHRNTLNIVKYYDGTADLRQRGLLLIPCVFAWPDVIVRTADPQPAVTYSPRGLGRLWESSPGAPGSSALAGVLGDSRAAILAQLDLPMSTTHLAGQLGLAAPTVNAHLKALSQAGIVTSRRDGHNVLYRRTPLGDHLIAAAAPR
jgi:DNA-binding transcriptional ArsR family regulator